MNFAIGEFSYLARFIAFPNNRNFVAAGLEMTINAVNGHIELGPKKPLNHRLLIVPLKHAIPRLIPLNELLCLCSPKAFRILNRLLIQFFVTLAIDVGISA